MDIEKNIEEMKKRTYLINDVEVDFRYFQSLIPQVLNKPATITPEYQKLCETFDNIADRVIKATTEIKTLISANLI